jgi:holo-[acyl-carrier protein] synthase
LLARKLYQKPLEPGIRKPILFKELEILRDEKGKPYFNPLGDVKKTIINLGITKTHVSLADESEHAIAFAILEI